MTLPMALTAARVALAPVFFVLWRLAAAGSAAWLVPVWLVFGLIEVSDLLDGHFARARGQESELGKVLDPFADSLARLTYFLCFAGAGIMPLWVLLVIVYRDLAVAYVRVVAANRKGMMAARVSGKVKAWVYAVAGIAGIAVLTLRLTGWFGPAQAGVRWTAYGLFILAAAVALWSLADYAASLVTALKGPGTKVR
jgi:CDP-diacylglycerol---glycerol-3-phosphate 3-phosphatidyltransferase